MSDRELQRLSFYLVPEKSRNRVVQLVVMSERNLTVKEVETGTTWTISRQPFERRLKDGRVVEVEPRWEPAGQTVEV